MAQRTIRKGDPMPYYAQLAGILRERIADGEYAPGEFLPSEADLCDQYGISRTAVRQALDGLVAEGIVRKEKGRGTYVAKPEVASFVVAELRGFFEEMTERGDVVETELIDAGIATVPPAVIADLQLNRGDEVVRLERVRKVNGEPVVAVRTYLPLARFPDLLDTHDFSTGSLYEVLSDDYGVQPRGGRRRFQAEAASAQLAASLDIAPGDPLVKLTAVNFDQDDQPFEYFVAYYRGDRAAFDLLIDTGGGRPDAVLDVKRKAPASPTERKARR